MDDKVSQTILDFLEKDLIATKQVAQSAMDIARDNKEITAVLGVHVKGLNEKIDELIKIAKDSLVTRVEFEPIKKAVFGAIAIILAEFIGLITYIIGWRI